MKSKPFQSRHNKILATLYQLLQLLGFAAGGALGFFLADPMIQILGLGGSSMALVLMFVQIAALAVGCAFAIRKLAPLRCEDCGRWSARHIKDQAEHCYCCASCQVLWRTGIGSSPSVHTPGQ